jgi:hypothetical protein
VYADERSAKDAVMAEETTSLSHGFEKTIKKKTRIPLNKN